MNRFNNQNHTESNKYRHNHQQETDQEMVQIRNRCIK